MAYRTITVDGTTYQYTTGRTHTKIKKVGVFTNQHIGHQIEMRCGCCGEGLNALYGEHPIHYRTGVAPGDIERAIKFYKKD